MKKLKSVDQQEKVYKSFDFEFVFRDNYKELLTKGIEDKYGKRAKVVWSGFYLTVDLSGGSKSDRKEIADIMSAVVMEAYSKTSKYIRFRELGETDA